MRSSRAECLYLDLWSRACLLEAAPPLWPSFLGSINPVRTPLAARLPKVASSSSSTSSSEHRPQSPCTQTDVTRQQNTQQIMCYFPQSSLLESFPFVTIHRLSLPRLDTHTQMPTGQGVIFKTLLKIHGGSQLFQAEYSSSDESWKL